jgi:Zn2+/Cd2+-exporting ATPase
MEAGIKSLDGIEEVSVDFVSKRLSMRITQGTTDIHTLIEQVTDIVNRIESDVILEPEDAHRHEEDGEHHHEHSIDKADLIKFMIGIALYLTAIVFKFSDTIEFILYFAAYLMVGFEVLLISIKNISRGQIFDENFLMSIATIGAFAIGEYPEGVAVMLFYQIGEFFQDAAVNNSRKSIKALMDIRPDYANLKIGDDVKKVSPEEIKVGDIIIIKPGEKVPVDGKVIEGNSMVDTTALTGESVPRSMNVGDDILSGFINKNGLLTVEVTKEFGESTVSKILDLVQNASSKKAPTEKFVTKFARYYTPVVVFIAIGLAVIPPLLISGATFADWLYRALIFLVVSCPCALVVSIPLGFFGGIGGASKNGILIKGSNYLEALYYVDTVVFDKTGTLTKGVFKVTEISTSNGYENDEILEYAAYAESYSTHPIAISIVKAYGKPIDKAGIQKYDEISGLGIKTIIKAREVLVGNKRLMEKENIEYVNIDALGSVVHIAIDKKYAGYIVISDELKQDSKKTIEGLRMLGIKKIVMLTGDLKAVGDKIGKELGVDEVHAELLPHQKVEKLEELELHKSPKSKLAFVGDGINDAPVLARADIGVAMGGLGSDAAIEAADIVIMTDEPSKLVSAIKIARRTRKIVWQNIVFAMVIKAVVLILGAGGLATMWEAVFADVGVAIVAILNAMRVINIKES